VNALVRDHRHRVAVPPVVSFILNFKDLLGPVTRVKKKKRRRSHLCSGSEAGSNLRLVYHPTLGLRVIKKEKKVPPLLLLLLLFHHRTLHRRFRRARLVGGTLRP